MRKVVVGMAILMFPVATRSEVIFDAEIMTFDTSYGPFDVFVNFRPD
jgi:hypothetical protein